MAEYIKREDLIKEMESVTNDITCPIHIAAEIDQIIALIPASDVAEIRHGEWEEITTHNGCTFDYDCVCSECNASGLPAYNYCPNCGAKMDGKDGE